MAAENQLILDTAKFLQEIEEKAWKRVVATLKPEVNILNFSGFVMSYQDPQLLTTTSSELAAKWSVVIDINGQLFTVEDTCTYPIGTTRDEIGKKVWKSIHEVVAVKLMQLVMPRIEHMLKPPTA